MSSLFELNEHIRRIIALNFPQAVWVSAEVLRLGESRGHYYLELVQKGEDDSVVAQASGVIWASDFRRILATQGLGLRSVLREGLELKMLVRPDFHEKYGLKLQITDIDPAYTLGQIDMQRRQTVQSLKDAGLFDKNRDKKLPIVLQRIAVISSKTAAGLQDFLEQIQGNSFGYAFDISVFTAAVQGVNAGPEINQALAKIAKQADKFDCIAIVRGGGSRLDLSAFDGLELSTAIANFPLPVITGIGHDVDESVVDLVANRSLKTPTAVAEFILQHNLQFEGGIYELGEQLRDIALRQLYSASLQIEQGISQVKWSAQGRLQQASLHIISAKEKLPLFAQRLMQSQHKTLEQLENYCLALHPDNVLRRGFSITRHDGKVVHSASELNTGDELETRLKDGKVRSSVKKS